MKYYTSIVIQVMGRIHAILADGTVVKDVEVCSSFSFPFPFPFLVLKFSYKIMIILYHSFLLGHSLCNSIIVSNTPFPCHVKYLKFWLL